MKSTSWENVEDWYKDHVGLKGSYYHENVVIPNLIRLLDLKANSSLLDLACGQGIVERAIPEITRYAGYDLSKSLIEFAQENARNPKHIFKVGDVSKPITDTPKFSNATTVLALQNIKDYDQVIANAANNLTENGVYILVINHPYYRIPRYSSWEIDSKNDIQFRRVDKYMISEDLKIAANPSKGIDSETTVTYHNTLEAYTKSLMKHGLVIQKIEEWVSNKKSYGAHADRENRARKEFPLFMAIVCKKLA